MCLGFMALPCDIGQIVYLGRRKSFLLSLSWIIDLQTTWEYRVKGSGDFWPALALLQAIRSISTLFAIPLNLSHLVASFFRFFVGIQPSQKTFRTKRTLAKKQKQNRPLPHWCRLKTDNSIKWNAKRRNWRRTKLGL